MAELSPENRTPVARRGARGPLFYMGALGLIAATAVEAIAVSGRFLSRPLHGALEIMQAAVLITACVSMLTATLESSHATVRLLLNRVGPRFKAVLTRAAALVSALFFAGLLIASVWLAIEHWNDYEETELLHIPLRPLRLLCVLSMLIIFAVYAYRALTRRRGER